ncbi:hypothetical protein D3C79_855880 [compost metagenome]
MATLFPGYDYDPAALSLSFSEIDMELKAHAYTPRPSTCNRFRQSLWRRLVHRASRAAFDFQTLAGLKSSPTPATLAQVFKALELSTSEAHLLRAMMLDADIGANRVAKVANIEVALNRNLVYLSQWDQAQLYGYFAYPTVE